MPFADPDIAILQLVGRAGIVVADHIADRVFREDHEDLLSARKRSDAALERLVLKGYLEARPVTLEVTEAASIGDVAKVVGKTYFTQAFSLTQRATLEFNLPLPPTLRENFIEHHVRTMEAIGKVELRLRLRGYQVLGWETESELVREQYSGKVFDGRRENVIPRFPDAVLTVRDGEGRVQDINIEYVSRKYSDEMIREKHAKFTGPTIWAAPNASTAARVEAITGSPALLV